MKRYSIMVRETQADHEIELLQCETNPQQMVKAAQEKTLLIDNGLRRTRVARYEHVYFRDNHSNADAERQWQKSTGR